MKKFDDKQIEMIADVIEALEELREYLPLYKAVLKQTGDKKQAIDAVKFVRSLDRDRKAS